jgi:pyoverdine/dityrosine biosynthesis protein Dit1
MKDYTTMRNRSSITKHNNEHPDMPLTPAGHSPNTPDHHWVRNAFVSTVRLNENRHHARTINNPLRPIPSVTMPFRVSMLKPKVRYPDRKSTTLVDKVLSVLLNSNFRKGTLNTIAEHLPVFRSSIEVAIRESRAIELVLPTLPCKSTNPLCTGQPAHAIDLGEYAFFSQMRDIALSVENIFPPGIRINLICDGVVYADLFWHGDAASAHAYRDACVRIRDEMGIADSVRIVDMSWLTQKEPAFAQIRTHIEAVLRTIERTDALAQERFASLRRGMLFNLPLHEFAFDDVARLQSLEEKEWPPEILSRSQETALGFASFLLTAQHTRIITRAFPNAIRATVHPKSAPQIPLHLVNRNSVVFPYNGVTAVSRATWDSTGDLRSAIRTMRLYDALAQPGVSAVVRVGDHHPFFYMTE